MKKENWLSLIIPIFNLLFAGLLFAIFCGDGVLQLPLFLYTAGSAVSIFLVISYGLNICRQIPVHIATFIVAVAVEVIAINHIDFYQNENLFFTMALPIIAAVATVLIFLPLKCGGLEKLVLILTSPMVYMAFIDVFGALQRRSIVVA